MTNELNKREAPRVCLVIPVYRHLEPLVPLLKGLEKYNVPGLVIDDGNEPSIDTYFNTVSVSFPWIEVLRLEKNSGKGVASITGFNYASNKGFTHALFIDADGQHNINDVPKILSIVKENPEKIILGRPIFDHSAPLGRRLGRIVSQIWVWIETLSLTIADPLCGFRCYPLKPVIALIKNESLGKRMDFDIDILVRLTWIGLQVVNFDTSVLYLKDGVSNYRMIKDNVSLTWLHTRLFFESLAHWPRLLIRRWKIL